MIHTLEDLKSGKLIGTKRLKLACGLLEFPNEIIALADTLEILDLTDNQLSELPDSIAELKKLSIIFLSNNNFVEFPKILASCPKLRMIGIKSNRIKTVPENSFPPLLRWLILTDNQIEVLPKSIGKSHLLQKCALAGNLIKELPNEMANCENIELLRVSANRLQEIPRWLFELPKLSWLAFSGNPASLSVKLNNELELFDWNDFEIQELLGEGASGLISKANWISKNKEVAIKVFKGEVTSDGLPEDEMDVAILAENHSNLVPVLGKIKNHPENKIGLIMELIAPNYSNLGNPPNLNTCTRDVFDETTSFTNDEALKIVKSIASVSYHLHSKGINHGDLYTHNILINQQADCLLGDYGAASFYDVNFDLAPNIERIEVRAFGCLAEDIYGLIDKNKLSAQQNTKWQNLIADCVNLDVKSRPSFGEIIKELENF